MLWIVLAIVVLVVFIILFKAPKEDQVPQSSLESRKTESTNFPEDSRDEFRPEFLNSKREKEA